MITKSLATKLIWHGYCCLVYLVSSLSVFILFIIAEDWKQFWICLPYHNWRSYFTHIFSALGLNYSGCLAEGQTKLNHWFSFSLELCRWGQAYHKLSQRQSSSDKITRDFSLIRVDTIRASQSNFGLVQQKCKWLNTLKWQVTLAIVLRPLRNI